MASDLNDINNEIEDMKENVSEIVVDVAMNSAKIDVLIKNQIGKTTFK